MSGLKEDNISDVLIDGYSCVRKERGGAEKVGGFATYIKDGLNAFPWEPTVCNEFIEVSNERQWVLVESVKQHMSHHTLVNSHYLL